MRYIGIIGSRRRVGWYDIKAVQKAFDDEYQAGDRIVSGGCPEGADRFADRIARESGIPILTFYAAWGLLGKQAGFARNGLIAREAEVLIACVAPDRTGGTEDTIQKFKQHHPGGKLILV